MEDLREIKMFISYANEDRENGYLDDIKSCIEYPENQKVIIWDDGEITLGSEWDQTIKQHLEEADIIFLLISRDFLKSKYIGNVELKRALEKHKNKECTVIPVFIRQCLIEDYPEITKLQGYPKGNFFGNLGRDIDKYYTELEQAVKNKINEIRTNAGVEIATSGLDDVKKKEEATIIKKEEDAEKKIFLAQTSSLLGNTMRDFFLTAVSKEREINEWEFTVEDLDFSVADLKKEIDTAIYTVHIFTSEEEIKNGIEKQQYDLSAGSNSPNMQFKKPILWISTTALMDFLPSSMKSNKIVIGTKPTEVIDLIITLEKERQAFILSSKVQFSPQKNVYMVYNFESDHTNQFRIKIKEKLESKPELVNYFHPPNASFNSVEEQLKLSKGVIIFYGNTDANWYCYWQAEIQKLRIINAKAIGLADPNKHVKLDQDVSKTAFLVLEDDHNLDKNLNDFVANLV